MANQRHRGSFVTDSKNSSADKYSPLQTRESKLSLFQTNNVQDDTPLLEDLWRLGIPVKCRKVLWPFKIDNKLGITQELYYINR